MDNQTTQLVITTIIQSMSTIWIVLFSLTLGIHAFIDRKRKLFNGKILTGTTEELPKNIIIENVRISKEDKRILFTLNFTMPFSILFGILSLIFFRNDILIYLTIGFTITSIILLIFYLTMWIKNLD